MGVCWVYTTLCVRLYVSLSGHVDMWIGLNVGDAFFTVYCLFLCCVFFVQRSEDVLVASKSTTSLPFLLLFFFFSSLFEFSQYSLWSQC